MKCLRLHRCDDGSFFCVIPAEARNRWCVLVLRPAGQRRDMPARVRLRMEGDPASSFETYVPAPSGILGKAGRVTVIYIPAAAASLHIDLFGIAASVQSVEFCLLPVSRTAAAGLFAICHPVRLLAALRGGRRGVIRRVRTALALLAGTPAGYRPYPLWIELFDSWGRKWPVANAERGPALVFGVVVLQPGNANAGLDATLGSIAAQPDPIVPVIVHGTGDAAWLLLEQALDRHDAPYIAVLQAGEVLRPHALTLIGEAISGEGGPDAIFADEDALGASGQRRKPLFKPEANHSLMLSGTLTGGIWVFRRTDLLTLLAEHDPTADLWAETLRLETWLLLYERPAPPRTCRLAFVLTHRRDDLQAAPFRALAETVRRHISRTGLPAVIEHEHLPLQLRYRLKRADQPMISIIVPTAARSPHVTECLSAVLAQTDYVAFEMLVVVSQNQNLDDQQLQVLGPILGDPRVRFVQLPTDSFNFSEANNFGVRLAKGALICMLNDDVAPMRPDWLAGMAGHLADPRIGAVGAKLYYPNRTIQHAGIIAGLAGLAAHVNRMLAQGEPGYASRAVLNQEVSAVTGACLLVRRSVFDAVGGLDEAYPIAFNDVDFCFRIREAGHGIVFSAGTEMWHYESVSLGHHFAGARAAKEASELLRMRTRWSGLCLNDPFHNPNLSQERGAEWELAFPPRLQPPPDLR